MESYDAHSPRIYDLRNKPCSLSASRLSVCTVCLLLSQTAPATGPEEVAPFHEAQAEHCNQLALLAIADSHQRFEETFECGDELFATRFNILGGVGANVGNNLRFTRVPRADLRLWMAHKPPRPTGPNAEACTVCHLEPFEDGSGAAGLNVVRDPLRTGLTKDFIQRNTPHLFGAGALQRLAEEMTEELHAIVRLARRDSCIEGHEVSVDLDTKNVSYGTATINCGENDLSGIQGIDDDLIVKPFGWKGDTKSIREFNRNASNNELGMQAVEIVGGKDWDLDGVSDEFSIGDISALTVYVSAQPRPATKLELHRLGLLDLAGVEISSIRRGERKFHQTGCTDCHKAEMVLDLAIFSEPSQSPSFGEAFFPAGQLPSDVGVFTSDPIRFDLTADQPDNAMQVNGRTIHLGSFERRSNGGAVIRLYGDLKRHYMGEALAESVDETGAGPAVWITKELWGVGSTAPYLHDGRATTLTEAVLWHGGDAQSARDAAIELPDDEFADMIAFLNNLILFKVNEEQEIVIFGNRPPKKPKKQ
jgi:hypothetical protein